MAVVHVVMKQFRNYQHAEFDFAPNMNIFYGPNGTGKTSVLEALHCLAVAKSFRTAFDKELVKHGEDFYQLEGEFSTEDNKKDTVQLNYVPNQGKKLFINHQEQKKLSSVVGRYPVVTLTPEDSQITTGAPSIRRQYINKIMSQGSEEQMKQLIHLRQILQQRNALLQDAADSPSIRIDNNLMEVFDNQLIEVSEKIAMAREEFFWQFREMFQFFFQSLSEPNRTVTIRFNPFIQHESSEQYFRDFRESLKNRRSQELGFRRTIVGPQSDIIDIHLDGMDLRKYGSQGEHKLVLVALKLAEGRFLRENMGKPPIYLFDDLFAELDAERSQNILQAIDTKGQIIITSTELGNMLEQGIRIAEEDTAIFNLSKAKYSEKMR